MFDTNRWIQRTDDHIISWLKDNRKWLISLSLLVSENAAVNLFHSQMLSYEIFSMGLPTFEQERIRQNSFWTRVAIEVC